MDNGETPSGGRLRERLLQDHREIEACMEEVLRACAADDRERFAAAWTTFEKRLLSHMDVEERYLIPVLLRLNERAARAILEEHKHFRSRLAELATGVDLHLVKLATVRAWIDELRAHAAHEDRVLYVWADQHIDDARRRSVLAALGARILAHTGTVT